MSAIMGIYEIVNWEDGKASSYVGSSVDIEQRWRGHRCALRQGAHHSPYLQHAWDKYGEDAFVFSVLEEVEDADMLLAMEEEYIADYVDRGHCYNILLMANAPPPRQGWKHSEESKRKMSKAHKGKPGPMLGRCHTEETKRKMSEAHRGKKRGPMGAEHKRKIGEANTGKLAGRPKSEETKRRMSVALLGNQRFLGHKHSDEARRKISASLAKPYPAFVHHGTGEAIPRGCDLTKLCRERGLSQACMWRVMHGKRKHHKGWTLANNQNMERWR